MLAPAIDVAEQGYPITENLARGLDGGKGKLGKFPSTTKIWFRDGKPLVMGDVVKNPDLAKTLRAIATQGPAGFYTGPVAEALVAGMRAHGGIISEEDLASYKAFEAEPIHVNYRGYEVYECPPNSQGHTMLQALNILEGFNLRYMGHNSAPPTCTWSPSRSSWPSPTATSTSPIRRSRRTSRCASCCRRSTRRGGGR